jgi:prepilin peptidase CpaA
MTVVLGFALVGLFMWDAFVIIFVLIAAVGDVYWRKIPRVFTVTGFVIGLVFHARHGGFLSAVAAGLLGFVIGLSFFQLGAIGGGDVKLVAALGAMLGFSKWMMAMKAAILVAGAMALVQIVRHGAVRQTVHNMGDIVRNIFAAGLKPHPVINVQNPASIRSPFGVAAAVGTFVAVFWR